MSIEVENSVYVGGLPYDCSDSQLRRAFELYGSILSVKIINDRGMKGKCYGFVTFKNPRSSVEAISEMDGKTIGGRVVRVNEAKSRGAGAGGRPMQGRESFRPNQRDAEWDERRGRGRDKFYDRDRQANNAREFDGERERRYDRSRERDPSRDHFEGIYREKSRDTQDRDHINRKNHDQEPESNYDFDATKDKQVDVDVDVDHDRWGDKNKNYRTKRKHSSSYDPQSKELSSESSGYDNQVDDQLDILIKRRDNLQEEKADMEQRLDEKNQLIVSLEKRSMKLEDSLTSAKKLSAMRQMQLTKLCKCFQQVKEYSEKLKSSEQELQDLVDSINMEVDPGAGLGTSDLYFRNDEV